MACGLVTKAPKFREGRDAMAKTLFKHNLLDVKALFREEKEARKIGSMKRGTGSGKASCTAEAQRKPKIQELRIEDSGTNS